MLHARSHPEGGTRLHRRLRGLGACLVTGGLIVLLWLAYTIVATDLFNEQRQAELDRQLRAGWTAPTVSQPALDQPTPVLEVPVGAPIGVLHIPRLGADYQRVVVEGTAEQQLALGPGHYIGTAGPGQVGNVALAGHRVGQGSPFLELDLLRPGDRIVLETADTWFVYRVLGDPLSGDFEADPSGIPGRRIVAPTDAYVIAPVPSGAPGERAHAAFLTLTTCHPKFSARQRLVIHAVLDGSGISKAQSPGMPPSVAA